MADKIQTNDSSTSSDGQNRNGEANREEANRGESEGRVSNRGSVFYPGSFDPPTLGHFSVIASSLKSFEHITIAVGMHHQKNYLFTLEQRLDLVESLTMEFPSADHARISTTSFSDLAVDAAARTGIATIIRGIRNSSDLDYELQMAAMNQSMNSAVNHIFVPPSPDTAQISSGLVKQILLMKGDIKPFVSKSTYDYIMTNYPR